MTKPMANFVKLLGYYILYLLGKVKVKTSRFLPSATMNLVIFWDSHVGLVQICERCDVKKNHSASVKNGIYIYGYLTKTNSSLFRPSGDVIFHSVIVVGRGR